MGISDMYGELGGQLKVGDVNLCVYHVGDPVSIPDGVYITWVSVIVVKDGVFLAEYRFLTNKWGRQIRPRDIIHNTVEEL